LEQPCLGGEIHAQRRAATSKKVKALLADNPDLVPAKTSMVGRPYTSPQLRVTRMWWNWLIANKADVNAFNQHFTPLHAAGF